VTEQETIKLKGFLGLCYRAGQVILGQDACVEAVRRNQAALVLLDETSTDVSRKRFSNACTSHRVPLYGVPGGLIAQALGKEGRMAAAVRPGTMAQKLQGLIREESMTDCHSETNLTNESANIAGVRAEI
jgi:ribosomal protein L7Ae-like RNA K-turn-binding protein